MPKPQVLILCTGNSARSQMAEGLLRNYVGNQFDIYSAGLEPKPVNTYAIQAMNEIGIDISSYTSKDVKQFLGKHFTYLITVCSNAEARCPIFPSVIWRIFWPFDDPAAAEGTEQEKLAKFREVRDQIDTQIRQWVYELQQKQVLDTAPTE